MEVGEELTADEGNNGCDGGTNAGAGGIGVGVAVGMGVGVGVGEGDFDDRGCCFGSRGRETQPMLIFLEFNTPCRERPFILTLCERVLLQSRSYTGFSFINIVRLQIRLNYTKVMGKNPNKDEIQ